MRRIPVDRPIPYEIMTWERYKFFPVKPRSVVASSDQTSNAAMCIIASNQIDPKIKHWLLFNTYRRVIHCFFSMALTMQVAPWCRIVSDSRSIQYQCQWLRLSTTSKVMDGLLEYTLMAKCWGEVVVSEGSWWESLDTTSIATSFSGFVKLASISVISMPCTTVSHKIG